MNYITILIFLLLLIVIYFLLKENKILDTFVCPKTEPSVCHYLTKKDIPKLNYYMNHDNFLRNVYPYLNSNSKDNKYFIKRGIINDVRKNLNYYYTNYNNPFNKINSELFKNKHIELVLGNLRSNKIDIKLKVKILLTLFDFTKEKGDVLNIIFSPYSLTKNNKIINVSTNNDMKIKIIGLFDFKNKRVDLTKMRDHNHIDISDFDINSEFTKDEINLLCKTELSSLCLNVLNFLNDSLRYYKETTVTTPSTTSGSCDIFSSQTEYPNNIKYTFY